MEIRRFLGKTLPLMSLMALINTEEEAKVGAPITTLAVLSIEVNFRHHYLKNNQDQHGER